MMGRRHRRIAVAEVAEEEPDGFLGHRHWNSRSEGLRRCQ